MIYYISETDLQSILNKIITRYSVLILESEDAKIKGDTDTSIKKYKVAVELRAIYDVILNDPSLTEEGQFNLVQRARTIGELDKVLQEYSYECSGNVTAGGAITLPIDHNNPAHIINTGVHTHAEIDNHIDSTDNPHQTSVTNLSDTTITSPSVGQVLTWDGSNWVNSSGVIEAINGLGISVDGKVIQGGPLDRDTAITTDNYAYQIGNTTDYMRVGSLGNVGIYSVSGSNSGSVSASSQNWYLSRTSSGQNTTFSATSTGVKFTDGRNAGLKRGIEYGDKYHADYTLRSLVDVEYVQNFAGGARNGLTSVTDVGVKYTQLGGALITNTVIDLDSYQLNFGREDVALPTYMALTSTAIYLEQRKTADESALLSLQNGRVSLYGYDATGNNYIQVYGSGIIAQTYAGLGIRYAADYSSTLTNLSLTHKQYTDLHIAGRNLSAIAGSNPNSPQVSNDGHAIVWDQANSVYKLSAVATGGGFAGFILSNGTTTSVVESGDVISILGDDVTTVSVAGAGSAAQSFTIAHNIWRKPSATYINYSPGDDVRVGLNEASPLANLHIKTSKTLGMSPTNEGAAKSIPFLRMEDGSTGGFIQFGEGSNASSAYLPLLHARGKQATTAQSNRAGLVMRLDLPEDSVATDNTRDSALIIRTYKFNHDGDGGSVPYVESIVNSDLFQIDNNDARKFVINASGWIGIGGITAPVGEIEMSSTVQKRKLILNKAADNDHQYNGLGLISGGLVHQTSSTSTDHVFYAATSSAASNEVGRIYGAGGIRITDSTALASAVANGTLKWNVSGNKYQYAIGGAWTDLVSSGTTYTGTTNQIDVTGSVISASSTMILPGTLTVNNSTTIELGATDTPFFDVNGNGSANLIYAKGGSFNKVGIGTSLFETNSRLTIAGDLAFAGDTLYTIRPSTNAAEIRLQSSVSVGDAPFVSMKGSTFATTAERGQVTLQYGTNSTGTDPFFALKMRNGLTASATALVFDLNKRAYFNIEYSAVGALTLDSVVAVHATGAIYATNYVRLGDSAATAAAANAGALRWNTSQVQYSTGSAWTWIGAVSAGGTGSTSFTGNRLVYSNSGGTALVTSANATFDGTDFNLFSNTLVVDSGNVRINTASAQSQALYVTGSILATGTVSGSSDARLKSNIEDLQSGLAEIMKLKAKLFNKKGVDRRLAGFIAQEVLSTMPYAVEVPNDPITQYYGITDSVILAYLTKAVQELNDKIDALNQA